MKGYCPRCQKMQEMKDPNETTLRNRRKVFVGKCPECGSEIYNSRGE